MNARRRACRSGQHGALLIEALVSILIFSFGILGLVAIQARAIQLSTNAEDRSRAALLADEIATTMWAAGTTTLPAATIDGWGERVDGTQSKETGLPSGAGAITVAADGTATITITWQPPFAPAGEVNRLVTSIRVPPTTIP